MTRMMQTTRATTTPTITPVEVLLSSWSVGRVNYMPSNRLLANRLTKFLLFYVTYISSPSIITCTHVSISTFTINTFWCTHNYKIVIFIKGRCIMSNECSLGITADTLSTSAPGRISDFANSSAMSCRLFSVLPILSGSPVSLSTCINCIVTLLREKSHTQVTLI